MSEIRTVALGVLIQQDHLLVGGASFSPDGSPSGWRPLGGAVEFGERAVDAVVREFREETGRDIEVLDLMATTENLFEVDGAAGHEVVFQYHVRFADGQAPPDLEPLPCVEHDGGRFEACWLPLAEVLAGTHVVYPDGFRETLAAWVNRL